jgi:glucose/mannose-6-phosphate isomerase
MISLDDEQKIKEIDRSGMLEVVESIPQMIRESAKLAETISASGSKEAIFVAGMGGSAVAGDLLANLLRDQLAVPFLVNRDYTFPACLNEKSLVFICSYSGDTEETISCFREAEKAKAGMVCLTSDGKIKELASAKKIPVFDIKKGIQPRAALSYFLVPILKILEKSKLIGPQAAAIEESAAVIEQLKNTLGGASPERQNPAKQMAKRIYDKTPIIFASAGTTEAIGKRLKNQLNENAKLNVLLSVFPELNHNEMVGFSGLKRGEHGFAGIFVRDDEDQLRVSKRIEITKSMLGSKLGGVMELPRSGKSRLARMFSQIFFADLLSVYAAYLAEVDPTPVDAITRFKKEMSR